MRVATYCAFALAALLPGAMGVVGATRAAADESTSTHREEIVEFHRAPDGAKLKFFDLRHHADWAIGALEEVSGERPPDGASSDELAALTAAQLDRLPAYGQKSVAMVQPVPDWFLEGYQRYNGSTVAKSRYLNGVASGAIEPDRDTAALYAFWCLYDAEWFSLSRKPGYKAWLSAVALSYPPQWLDLHGESAGSLHERLVAPLQTPDEPYREIDNWIKSFTRDSGDGGELGAFIKPKVRDALVEELLGAAGEATDDRFYEYRAYTGDAPERLGLSDKQFYLLAALTLEFFQEIYAADPDARQPLHFRDYFVGAFRGAS